MIVVRPLPPSSISGKNAATLKSTREELGGGREASIHMLARVLYAKGLVEAIDLRVVHCSIRCILVMAQGLAFLLFSFAHGIFGCSCCFSCSHFCSVDG